MDNYRQKIDNIKNRVGNYSNVKIVTKGFTMPTINKHSVYFYISIPIIILTLLLLFSPSFIKKNYIDENGEDKQKINIPKTIYWTLGITLIVIIGLYAYNYNK